MTFPFFHYNAEQEPPFTIFVEHRDNTRDRHWRPAAFVMLTPSLRTSGFLFALPPEELQSFLLLLTFITADGRIAPITAQLAEAMGMSEAKTRARMERLLKAQWQGQCIAAMHDFGKGQQSYSPVAGLLPFREEENVEPPQVSYHTVPREVIIEQSRRLYARPRAEVEYEINQFLSTGRYAPSTIPTSKPLHTAMTYQETPSQNETYIRLRDALIQNGIYPEQADELLVEYDHERIQRQLLWLPYRGARNPAGLLIAAIRNDYEAPVTLLHNEDESEAAIEEPDIDTTALKMPDDE